MTKRATKKDAYPDTSDLAFPIKYCRHIRLVSVTSDLRSKTLILVHMRCAPYRFLYTCGARRTELHLRLLNLWGKGKEKEKSFYL